MHEERRVSGFARFETLHHARQITLAATLELGSQEPKALVRARFDQPTDQQAIELSLLGRLPEQAEQPLHVRSACVALERRASSAKQRVDLAKVSDFLFREARHRAHQ